MKIQPAFACVLIIGTLGFAIAQEHVPSTDELLQSVPQLSSIPGLENFNTSSVKTEDFEKLFREKCEKNGGPEAFDVAKRSRELFTSCLQSLVNMTQLQTEMTEAKPQGELDAVFKKYCNKVPNFKRCVKNVTDSHKPCLEAEERESIKIVHNITSSLLEFICHNDGDRIAMFIAAGGVECFKSKQQSVGVCANETFGNYVPAANPAGGAIPEIQGIPMLVLNLKECSDIEKFGTCTVRELEECTDPTPANVVESLFNFVKRVTPCENLLKAKASAATGDMTGSSGFNGVTSAVNILLIITAMAMSVRLV